MIRLKIININKKLYTLEDENGNKYEILLDFLDISTKLCEGDTIYINEQLLDDNYVGYSDFYAFGHLDNGYGKENISLEDEDVIILLVGNEKIYLKRLYG